MVSWWDREVRVWRIVRPPPVKRSNEDHSTDEGPLANKLVSRIMVQVRALSDLVKDPVLIMENRARKISLR